MRTTSVCMLVAMILVLSSGVAAASLRPSELDESVILWSPYLTEPDLTTYLPQHQFDWDRFCTKCELKNASGTWESVEPTMGMMSNYKPVALNPDFTKFNTMSNWESSVVVAKRISNNELGILDPNFEKITSKLAGYFFGAGGGAPAGGGGGCCG